MKPPLIVMLGLALLSAVLPVSAQDVIVARFNLEKSNPLIGEPVSLWLTVEAPANATVALPEFPSDWPPFTITSIGDVTPISNGATVEYRQQLTIVAWQPGLVQTPQSFISYQATDASQPTLIPIEPAALTIPSVLPPDDLALRPLKPLVTLPYLSPWLVLAAAILLGTVAVFVIRWYLQRRTTLAETTADKVYSPEQLALAELRRLARQTTTPGQLYPLVANCLRVYVQRRFTIPALDMTTSELTTAMRTQSRLSERRQRELRHLLDQADLVKFANREPAQHSANRLLSVAQQWVESTDKATNGEKPAP